MKIPNKPGLLARVFNRSESAVVTQLYTHALGKPLMVHPAMGQNLIGAYLSGAVDARADESDEYSESGAIENSLEQVPEISIAKRVVVLNISGGLAHRKIDGPCPGPLSYEEIRASFDRLIDDETVSAIVFRMDSPGGMASGLFDLTDHIFSRRGIKPIVAVIDDMAFSACYALASACDEVVLSRTGGVGSVGVICYHVDYSGANAQAGVVVTPIYAGSHKNDLDPDQPLGDEARANAQKEIDSLYNLFTSSVASYRGLSVDAVKATEALCYYGQAAVEIGFADRVGTLHEVLEGLTNPAAAEALEEDAAPVEDDAPPADPEAPQDAPEDVPADAPIDAPVDDEEAAQSKRKAAAASHALAIQTAIKRAAGTSLQKSVLDALLSVSQESTLASVALKVHEAKAIAKACTLAGKPKEAVALVKAGASIEDARMALRLAAIEADEKTAIATQVKEKTLTAPALSTSKIYAAHKAASTPKTRK